MAVFACRPHRRVRVRSHRMADDGEHARQRREEMIEPKRRAELTSQAEALMSGLSDPELRYVRDRISARLAKGRGG